MFADYGKGKTGVAIVCDEGGRVVDVIRDDVGIGQEMVGRPFTLLVDRGSLSKALTFVNELRREGALSGWEMNVAMDGKVSTLHFAGAVVDGRLVIVAARNGEEMMDLYEELMRMGNEQTNALRAALKAQAEAARGERERDSSVYDDISALNNQLVAMQRELAKKNAELERLDALKNRFLGMAAHDLRNPLNVIYNYAEFLGYRAGERLDDEERSFLEAILESSQFMSDLINDLLDVSRIESGKLQLVWQAIDLTQLVERNLQLNRLLAGKKEIELVLDVEAAGVPTIIADPGKLEQVLNNLISNAVKYSPLESRVVVRLRRHEEGVLISVEDEGIGIAAEEMDQLFRPFVTPATRGPAGEKSTGLGLVIVRRIVEGHGGDIWVESEEGVGTTFYVWLPRDPVAVKQDG